MTRLLLLIAILTTAAGYAQEDVDVMVDSLNFAKSRSQKIDISQRIALRLQDTDWNRALSYLELARSEANKLKDPAEQAELYVTAAHIYNEKDVLDVALDYYQKAYEIYREAGNIDEEIKIENNLAIIYARLQNKEKALLYFRRVYAYQKQQGDSLRLAQILNNIGTLYLETNPDSSLYYYKKSLPLANELGDPIVSTYVYTNIGRAYASLSDSSAMQYFRKALSYARSTNDKPTKSLIYLSLADYYHENSQFDSAVYYGNKTMTQLADNAFNFSSQRAVKILYESYFEEGDYKNAATYFNQYNTIRDSLNIVDAAVNVERLKLQQEYLNRSQIQQLSTERARYKYYFVGFALLAGILILLLVVVRFRNRIAKNTLEKDLLTAKQKELRYDLDVKNQVMVSKAMEGMHRADMINGVIDDLKKLRLELNKKANQYAVDQIQNRLKRDLNTDIWQEFELSFEQVHNSFYTNLNASHPDLTPKDRRLCALLYLDLSSKEISQLTGQSYKSIENARTRLRRKLDLTNEKVNLSSYLISLE